MPTSQRVLTTQHPPWTRRLEGTWIAERLSGLDRINREALLVQRLVKKTQDKTLGTTTEEPMDKLLEEDMGVTVGDTIHNHNYPPPTAEPVVTAEPVQVPAPTPTVPAWLPWALGMIAGLLLILTTVFLCWLAFADNSGSPATQVPTTVPIFDVSGPPAESE